jgi:capsular exopolysaccharide synthesis family protein
LINFESKRAGDSPARPGLANQYPEPRETLSGEVSIKSLLMSLWRRRWVIVLAQLIVVSLAALWLMQVPSTYLATGMVVLNARQPEIIRVDPAAPALVTTQSGVETEMEVLQSPALAEQVIDKLRLLNDPEFNLAIAPDPQGLALLFEYIDPRAWLRSAIRSVRKLGQPSQPAKTEDDTQNDQTTATINQFLNNLRIDNSGQSYGITVSFVSEDPKKAAQITNAIIDQYLVSQLEAKYDAMRRANGWLSERVEDLRKQVEESDRAVQAYREKADLVQARGQTISAQQLSELNTQLVVARTDLAAAEARLRGMRDLVRSGKISSAPEVLQSGYIQTLKQQEATLARQLAELTTRYGERHPQIITIKAQLRDVRGKIEGEVQQVVNSLESEVSVLRTRVASMEQNLQSAKASADQLERGEVKLADLQREADANRAIYQDFLARFKETSNQVQIQQADARIVSRAREPVAPTYPRSVLVLLAAVVGGTLIGLVAVILAEQFDTRLRTTDQVEQISGENVIGVVPEVRKGLKGTLPHEFLVQQPESAYSESLRSILASLQVYNQTSTSPVFLVTSALPEDGKTTLVLSLGIAAALSGRRAVVVDADLRRHSLSTLAGISPDAGLTEYLKSSVPLSEIVYEHTSGVNIVPIRTPRKAGPEWSFAEKKLLSSDRMRNLLDVLSRQFDLVIIDSPPVNVLADASMLASAAKATLFVVRWGRSTGESLQTAVQQLRRAGATLAGVVLARVDLRRHRGYGYRDQAYYYGLAQKYYRSAP